MRACVCAYIHQLRVSTLVVRAAVGHHQMNIGQKGLLRVVVGLGKARFDNVEIDRRLDYGPVLGCCNKKKLKQKKIEKSVA